MDVPGASDNSVDLLPDPSAEGSWTKDLPTDDGQDSDQIFAFDGRTTAIEVSAAAVSQLLDNFDLGARFTLSTWMKHDGSDDDDVKHHHGLKEHILCHSDADGKFIIIIIIKVIRLTWYKCKSSARPRYNTRG